MGFTFNKTQLSIRSFNGKALYRVGTLYVRSIKYLLNVLNFKTKALKMVLIHKSKYHLKAEPSKSSIISIFFSNVYLELNL